MTKIDVNHNFYEDVKGDPDLKSSTLYEYHNMLWNKGCLNGLLKRDWCELKLSVENNDGIQELRLGTDNFVALYMDTNDETGELKYKVMRERNGNKILNKQKKIRKNWETEDIKYTIGGSIIFPRFRGGLNPTRGFYNGKYGIARVGDRIDITLACIKSWFENHENQNKNQNDNPLWDCLEKNENQTFFSLFGQGEDGFINYINFFLFQDFVNTKTYGVKNLCAGQNNFKQSNCPNVIGDGVLRRTNNLPETATEYENLYHNLIWAITQRTQRIKKYAKDKGLIDQASEAQNFEIKFDLLSILHNK